MSPMEGLRGTVMVTKDGSTLTELAGGLADAENGLPCTSHTRFQLCSVSKQFTAAAVMLLVESGLLDLAEPVVRWLPGAPSHWRQVTLHHLLSHTGGVPHWHEAAGLDPIETMSTARRLEATLASPLRSEPGAQWHYSSPGFLLVGLIIEKATGKPYRDFLIERILLPLQLTDTTVGATSSRTARGYVDSRPVVPFELDTMRGTGDICSTAADLTKFVIALHRGELITASSLGAICSAKACIADDDEGEPRLAATGYGYGMFTGVFATHTALYHPGDNPGYQSMACWIPDLAASIVILVNDEAVNMTGLLTELLFQTLQP